MAASAVDSITLEGVAPVNSEIRPDVNVERVLQFETLEDSTSELRGGRGPLGTAASVMGHAALVAAVLVVPLLLDSPLPDPGSGSVHAFFAPPLELAPPPPPPPPPPASVKTPPKVEAPPVARSDGFVAPDLRRRRERLSGPRAPGPRARSPWA
jgi:hypothetical protein